MSNSLQINVSTSSVNSDPIYWYSCLRTWAFRLKSIRLVRKYKYTLLHWKEKTDIQRKAPCDAFVSYNINIISKVYSSTSKTSFWGCNFSLTRAFKDYTFKAVQSNAAKYYIKNKTYMRFNGRYRPLKWIGMKQTINTLVWMPEKNL